MKFEVVFETAISNHIFIPIFINDKKLNALIDTGATTSCICIELARFLKLNLIHNEEMAMGINENTMIRFDVNIPEINFNNKFSFENIGCAALNFEYINKALIEKEIQPIQFILGADFLIKNNAIIDYPERKLVLFPNLSKA